jgi:ribosomal protein S18
LLWEEKDIFTAISKIEKELNITIKFTKNTIAKHQRKLAKAIKSSGEDLD